MQELEIQVFYGHKQYKHQKFHQLPYYDEKKYVNRYQAYVYFGTSHEEIEKFVESVTFDFPDTFEDPKQVMNYPEFITDWVDALYFNIEITVVWKKEVGIPNTKIVHYADNWFDPEDSYVTVVFKNPEEKKIKKEPITISKPKKTVKRNSTGKPPFIAYF